MKSLLMVLGLQLTPIAIAFAHPGRASRRDAAITLNARIKAVRDPSFELKTIVIGPVFF